MDKLLVACCNSGMSQFNIPTRSNWGNRPDKWKQLLHLLPDKMYVPLGSTVKHVTASRWATIEWVRFPEKMCQQTDYIRQLEYFQAWFCSCASTQFTRLSSGVAVRSIDATISSCLIVVLWGKLHKSTIGIDQNRHTECRMLRCFSKVWFKSESVSVRHALIRFVKASKTRKDAKWAKKYATELVSSGMSYKSKVRFMYNINM